MTRKKDKTPGLLQWSRQENRITWTSGGSIEKWLDLGYFRHTADMIWGCGI